MCKHRYNKKKIYKKKRKELYACVCLKYNVSVWKDTKQKIMMVLLESNNHIFCGIVLIIMIIVIIIIIMFLYSPFFVKYIKFGKTYTLMINWLHIFWWYICKTEI